MTVQLIASFGFNEKTLRADSAILPIAYYVCHRKLDNKYITKGSHASDRAAIRSWLIRSLLKTSGIWGSGLDTLLTALRESIAKHGADAFPAEKLQEVMSRRGKSLRFTKEEIGELVEMQYGDKRLFAMLALLFSFVDVRNHFHIDHVFPKARFTRPRLKKAGVSEDDIEEFQEMADGLPNLQLLEGPENLEKLASMPSDWIEKVFASKSDKTNYRKNHLLGDVPDSMAEFRTFYTTRREALRTRIIEMLATKESDAESGEWRCRMSPREYGDIALAIAESPRARQAIQHGIDAGFKWEGLHEQDPKRLGSNFTQEKRVGASVLLAGVRGVEGYNESG